MKKKESDKNKKLNRTFTIIIIVFAFILYGNTIRNEYSLDDKLVVKNENVQKGISGIYKIFTSQYYQDETKKFGYRPMTQVSFAIERSLFGKNPHISHFISILFYILNLLLLFRLLKIILKGYNVWFPFIIVLLFMAHPVHTEVVASLKNREEIICYIFALLSVLYFYKFADGGTYLYIIPGVLFYSFGFVTKMSIITFVIIVPLFQYFFSNANWKRILLTFIILGILTLALKRLTHRAFDTVFNPYYFENPLYFINDFSVRIGTMFISLFYYLKLLFIPHPLISYYGYDTIPVVGFNNILVWISMLIHIALGIYALMGIRKKKLISFAILYYMVTISIFSNLLSPVPGIIAERLLYNVSLSFAIVLAFFLFKISGLKFIKDSVFTSSSKKVLISLMIIILVPYSIKTIARNTSWKNYIHLYKNDIKYAPKSYKLNDLYARELIQIGNFNKDKKKSRQHIIQAIEYLKRTAEIYPEYYHTWNNIALIYSDYLQDYKNAAYYFKKTVEVVPDYEVGYLNLGFSYEKIGDTIDAIKNYRIACQLSDTLLQARYNLSNILAKHGEILEAIDINREIINRDSSLYVPYMNIGNYYYISGDLSRAIDYYEKTLNINPNQPNLSLNISKLFLQSGDSSKSQYYFRLYQKFNEK